MKTLFRTAILLALSAGLTTALVAAQTKPTPTPSPTPAPKLSTLTGSILSHTPATSEFSIAGATTADPARKFRYDKATVFTQAGVAATPAALRVGMVAKVGYEPAVDTKVATPPVAKTVDVTKPITQ